jgi:hypothetical protein
MFGLNQISDFRRESRPSLRESLAASALGLGALAERFVGSSGRGLFIAAALGAGLMGGLVPHVLGTHSRSLAAEKLQKLESEQTADAQAVGMVAQANAALQARLDTLERRLSKVERASLDTNPTGAVAAPPPPKPDSKRKPPKN